MGKRKEFVDLTGQRFDKLVVMYLAGTKRYEKSRNIYNIWHCKCDCGNEIDVNERNLTLKRGHSCGCGKIKDLTGKRFGRLLVVQQCGRKTDCGKLLWLCKCDCGNIVEVSGMALVAGHTRSCGCYKRDIDKNRTFIHGDTADNETSRLYHVWANIKQRCYNASNAAYKYYGGRDIVMSEEWKNDYSSFKEWAYANGYDENAKLKACTIDRIDTNGNYCPENCRWVSMKVQGNNTRRNHILTYRGEEHTISEWSVILGINYKTIMMRLNLGWSVEKTFETPVRRRGYGTDTTTHTQFLQSIGLNPENN